MEAWRLGSEQNQKYNKRYMFIASYLYWQYLVLEFKKGVTVVNNSKRTKILHAE